jgi:putative transposase
MNFRRYYFPGQIVFITQVVKDRRKVFSDPEMIMLLREHLYKVKEKLPFSMLAYVFLPDHFHVLIQPKDGVNFSQIMHLFKFTFTDTYKRANHIEGRLNFWQKRFWDHVIRDEFDLENHIHYIHINPIKHGYVNHVNDWIHSSYFEWQKRSGYDLTDWVEPNNVIWGE